jgi:predicted AlkP superfamily pyrophosphatase or phosphodiesterase
MEDLKGSGETLRRAMQYWTKNRPHLMFIHLDDVDHAGHEKGHGTPEYYEAVRQAGELLAELGDAIKDSAAYLIVTADHGGKGNKHGGNTLEELEIPWMITGPKVRRGHQIQSSVNTFDTAATVAWLFQLRAPQAWIGRPVLEAFVSP